MVDRRNWQTVVWLTGLALMTLAGSVALVKAEAVSSEPEIYVVDIQRILDESISGKAARKTIEAEVKKSEGKLLQMKNDLERVRADFEKQVNVLSAGALEEKKAGLERRQRDFERALRDQRDELARRNETEMMKVVQEIRKIVDELAAKGSYPIIMEKDPRLVLYAGERVDLTNQVVGALDARKVAL